ncbi:queuosine precursor transporter [Candidatus Leptofilum sp.]|uniref:queuosine precursor transporter n=1 Tax=Candidatus Leptofilum sp. TaxID=3241576 RepID=UPI003B59D01B
MTVLTQTKGKEEAARAMATAVPIAAVIVVASYIGAQMLSDITSLKIGLIAGYAVDMGTFIYPITFTLRDLVHKTLGKRNAQALIVMAAAINLFMAAYLAWAASVPSDPAWGLGAEFSAILGPLWRIVIASILAELVSELVDTEVYHWFVTRITKKYQWARVLLSNSISVPIDNIIFAVGAFGALPFLQDHFLTLPWEIVWQIFVFNLIVKYGMTLISLPLIYLSPNKS